MPEVIEKERDIDIQIRCVSCGKTHTIYVNREDYEEYYNSEHRRYIQDIFPYLTPQERELLISGVCPQCWENIFSEDEDEYAEEVTYDGDLFFTSK